MKKCKKYLSLIYSELDSMITDKQKKDLADHIEKCDNCREEYMIIKQIKNDLSKEDKKPLPENFKQILHTKLVEANLSVEKHNRFRVFGNITATVCVALAITLFAVNMVPELEKAKDTEIVRADIKNQVSAPQIEISEENTDKPATSKNVNTKMRSLEPSTSATEQETVTDDDSIQNDISEQNTYSISAASELYESLPPFTITVAEGTDIKELIPYAEKNEDGTFKVPVEKLDEIKEILNDRIVSMENDISNGDYFIIKQ